MSSELQAQCVAGSVHAKQLAWLPTWQHTALCTHTLPGAVQGAMGPQQGNSWSLSSFWGQ